jgi:hypothetical protein
MTAFRRHLILHPHRPTIVPTLEARHPTEARGKRRRGENWVSPKVDTRIKN